MSSKAPVGDTAAECGVRLGWRKSSHSLTNGHCVEAAVLAESHVGIRDGKEAEGGVLRFRPGVWAAFLTEIRASPAG